MATYTELFNLRNDSALLNRIAFAIAEKAHSIILEASPTQSRLNWAEEAIQAPDTWSKRLIWYLLANHSNLTVEQITGVSDSDIQTAVDAAIDKLRP